ncbi:hypothetical protein CCAX7_15250 [Capsulimonas corticalis]|uniref:Uncharacterized protein n=1 Tax=Capsulimonas corticalis TaxID=2219043 RepID=A0A402CZD0_9BACT|nr:hypothetical protein [Capsulimonas corticalis]BDI29474.1 hypothetical protein CCAX7_15250 [Capsulimonas corticalis]
MEEQLEFATGSSYEQPREPKNEAGAADDLAQQFMASMRRQREMFLYDNYHLRETHVLVLYPQREEPVDEGRVYIQEMVMIPKSEASDDLPAFENVPGDWPTGETRVVLRTVQDKKPL